MVDERRSETSVGARLRGSAGNWGAWDPAGPAAAPAGAAPVHGEPAPSQPAIHDALTGLPNRLLLQDRLECALTRAARQRQRLAVAVVDLDGLAEIELQPGAGDALLVVTGQRLRQNLRASDTVARLGPQCFAIVLEGVHSAAVAAQVCDKLAAAVTQPCTLLIGAEGRPLRLAPRACIGIAVYPDHAAGGDPLLALATTALDQARYAGVGVQVHREGAEAAARAAGTDAG